HPDGPAPDDPAHRLAGSDAANPAVARPPRAAAVPAALPRRAAAARTRNFVICADAVRCLRAYSRKGVVAYYSGYMSLDKPEAAILRALAPRLARLRMLDVGVGGGRMTEHFAPAVAQYHGIDLSPEMVETCRRRFAG